ncbi:MAG: hypothetical protein H0W76_05820 [Pyrinomonadaceae bacterium]|nr:hypothetical protein [Pyrinomonadaceae bacterium]
MQMPDMLVNLLKLPPLEPVLIELSAAGVVVRRAQVFEITRVRAFVEGNFSEAWTELPRLRSCEQCAAV